MKFNFSKIFYYMTLVGPILNTIITTYKEIKEMVLKYSDNRKYMENLNKFNDDNMSSFEGVVKILNEKGDGNGKSV